MVKFVDRKLTEEELLIMGRVLNEPYWRGGELTARLVDDGFLKKDKDFYTLTKQGRKVFLLEFERVGGLADLVQRFYGKDIR